MLQAKTLPARAWLVGLLACSAACSGGEPTPGVIHLDPRLLTHESPADVLAARETEWLDEVVVRNRSADLDPWKLLFAERVSTPSGRGTYVRGNVLVGQRINKVRFDLPQTLEATERNVFALDIASPHNGVAAIYWSNDRDTGDEPVHVVFAPFEESSEPRPVLLSVGNHPDWVGKISKIRLVPMHEGRQRFELYGLRIGRTTFVPGPAPLEGDSGDGGLVALDMEARRTWPSDFGVPLYDRCKVPIGGRVALQVATTGVLRRTTEEVHFLVDARPVGDVGDWVNVARRSFRPDDVALGTTWQNLSGSLAIFGGREVDLRLRAIRGSFGGGLEEGTTGKLTRASVYWGTPIVIGELTKDRRPNIVLITLDTTRVDSIGAFTNGRAESRTPFIDKLAGEAAIFTNAWSACNSTTPSHTSILTGLHVQDHGVGNNRSILDPKFVTLAEELRAAGYYTAAAVSAQHLQAGHSGLGQGFDQFLLAHPDAATNGAITVEAVRTWLYHWHEAGDRPFFLWVHLFDPHTPYGPPQEFLDRYTQRYRRALPSRYAHPATIPPSAWLGTGAFLEGVTNRDYAEFLYRAEVSYADELVSHVWGEIELAGFGEQSALFLTADHGESLGERGLWFLHRGLFGEVMHVPLLYRPAGGSEPKRYEALVSTLDVSATILELLGVAPPPGQPQRGRSLLAVLRGEQWEDRRLWFEHSDQVQAGCRDSQYHFIQTLEATDLRLDGEIIAVGTRQLFNHASGAEMGREVGAARPKECEHYGQLLEEWRATALGGNSIRRATTPEEEAELRRLGYLDGE